MVYANRGRNDTRGRPGGVDSRYQKRTLFAVGELSIQSVYASVSSVGAMVVRSDELGRRRGAVGGRAGGVLPIGDRAPGRLGWGRDGLCEG